ncbi:MAG TPA: response regulator transcription factor [Acidobacteriaceae bacterium]
MRTLIVEDEPALISVLRQHLEAEGHDVAVASDGNVALARLAEAGFDLLLLDLNLPGRDGTEVLRAARSSGAPTSILVLSGRATLEDRLNCFELGADDCLAKPFALRELSMRIKALARRVQSVPNPVLRCADLELDRVRRSVIRSGTKIDLSAREYALAEYLIQHKGSCIPRATLLRKVWDLPEESGTNVVEVYVNYLRRKVDQGFAKPLIHTVRGEGYVMREVAVAPSGHWEEQEAAAGNQWKKSAASRPNGFSSVRSA